MKLIDAILYQQIRQNIGRLFLILCLMLLVVGFDVIAPWPFKILIDNVLQPNPIAPGNIFDEFLSHFSSRELLGFFAVFVYFTSTFLLSIVEYLRSVIGKRVIKKLISDFSKSSFKNLQSLEIGFYKKQQIGDYIYRLSYDVNALGELLEEGILPILTSGLYLAITATIMFLIDARLTVLSFFALPFLAVGLYSFNRYLAYATERSEYFNSAAFSFIEEALTHLKIIQAFSQEPRESRVFNEKIDTSLQSDVTLYRLDFLLTLLIGIIIAVSYSVIIIYGIRSVFAGTLTTGLLIVFIFYLDNLTIPILSIIDGAAAVKKSYVKIRRMRDFFSKKTHLYSTGKTRQVLDTTIEFQHVAVKIGRNTILRDVSFTIEPHKRTVIFGANGSGKTSIVNLLLRFIEKPTSGSIFIGGINILEYDLKSLREAIAFVPQEITLFNGTVAYNIGFGSHRSSLREVKRAAKLAAADEFIQKLPGKYHYRVGEGGGLVSGGQRQRLMLARAFMKPHAPILLFDETLSALDVRSRKAVLENIYQFSKGKTTIIVSNIFSVISEADNAIVMQKGKVIFSGSAARLSKESALYRMIIENE